MSEAKPFASLTPSLLARKGAARPAMRPQLQPLTFEEQNRTAFGMQVRTASSYDAAMFDPMGQEDLGWNDMGDDAAAFAPPAEPPVEPVVSITPDLVQPPVVEAAQPEVLRQIESLAGAIRAKAETATVPSAPVSLPQPVRRRVSALKEGRKAAFTLRLDAERHLRLRLACTLDNRSAQMVVAEALDRFLESMPGLDDLARRARRT